MAQLKIPTKVPRPSLYGVLDAVMDELDDIKREISLGYRSTKHYDDLEFRYAAATTKGRNAFRKRMR